MAESFNLTLGQTHLMGIHAGQGEAIVFLHAGVADKRMWYEQLEVFSKDYHAIAYDRRGFGETVTSDEVFSHVDDLRQILEYFSLSQVILVGSSQGGRVAIDFALNYPQQVAALILIAPAISGVPSPESFPKTIGEKLEALDKAEDKNELEQVNLIEANLWLDGPLSQAGRVSGEVRDLFLNMNGIALRHHELSEETSYPAAYERLTDISAPTLIVWGELDFPHIKERCQHLVETLSASQGKALLDTAHLPNLEQAQPFNNLIRAFLDEL